MIPVSLIVVAVVAVAAFVLGLNAIRRAVRIDRELHELQRDPVDPCGDLAPVLPFTHRSADSDVCALPHGHMQSYHRSASGRVWRELPRQREGGAS